MKVISNKDGDLLSQFDNINGNDIPILERLGDLPPQTRKAPQQKMFTNNHTDGNKKTKGYLYLEDIFRFCENFKKVIKYLGFHITFTTITLQNIIHTSMVDDINVTAKNLYLYVPNLIPFVETKLLFIKATQKIHKISYDECYTKRRVILDKIVQHDIGSTQQVNSPQYFISGHQIPNRIDTPNKNNNILIFDNLDPRKNYVDIDGLRYTRNGVLKNYEKNDYKKQYKDLKFIFQRICWRRIAKSSHFISKHENKLLYWNIRFKKST